MSTDQQPDPIPSSKNSDGLYEPFDTARVPVDGLTKGERFEMHWKHLSSFGGGTKIGVVLETLPAGKQTNQAHYHMLEEEHVYILEGELTVRLGKKHYVMKPGHYICFPAGQKAEHTLINHTDKPCRYILIGDNHPHDVVFYPDTGRVGVRLAGKAFRAEATMEYWDEVVIDRPPEIPHEIPPTIPAQDA
jgi:uncharacterized cupin superfamily protein